MFYLLIFVYIVQIWIRHWMESLNIGHIGVGGDFVLSVEVLMSLGMSVWASCVGVDDNCTEFLCRELVVGDKMCSVHWLWGQLCWVSNCSVEGLWNWTGPLWCFGSPESNQINTCIWQNMSASEQESSRVLLALICTSTPVSSYSDNIMWWSLCLLNTGQYNITLVYPSP